MALKNLKTAPHSDSEAIPLLPMLNVWYIILGLYPPTRNRLFPAFQLFLLSISVLGILSILISSLLFTARPW